MKKEEIKNELLVRCREAVAKRRSKIETVITDTTESLEDESKSSAGDKHETGRAMLHLEIEQAGNQLQEVEKIEQILKKIDTRAKSDYVRLGSLVHTTKAAYFVAISAGEFKVGETTYVTIALNSPMGELLKGKVKGDGFRFREEEVKVTTVY